MDVDSGIAPRLSGVHGLLRALRAFDASFEARIKEQLLRPTSRTEWKDLGVRVRIVRREAFKTGNREEPSICTHEYRLCMDRR